MSDVIKNFPARLHKITETFFQEAPSTAEVHRFVDSLINFLFPIRNCRNRTLEETNAHWEELQKHLHELIKSLCSESEDCCEEIVRKFFLEIPLIMTRLLQDAEVYYESDPASKSKEEVILCYPGFYAVMVHRFAHVLFRLKVYILPRIISEYAHSLTGIDIHPGATIGKRFYIDHGTGIVIGETSVIGDNVKLYQGVTLGAKFVAKELCDVRRHPRIEDNVIVYAGATILGGDTIIGHDTIIGGNVWLTESVPAGSIVYHRPEIVIKDSKNSE